MPLDHHTERPGSWIVGLTCCYCLDVLSVESGPPGAGFLFRADLPICECGGQRWLLGRIVPNWGRY